VIAEDFAGLVPKVAAQIEVHHLNPIAEGVRHTRLEDLRRRTMD
jgi:hypothetical protein